MHARTSPQGGDKAYNDAAQEIHPSRPCCQTTRQRKGRVPCRTQERSEDVDVCLSRPTDLCNSPSARHWHPTKCNLRPKPERINVSLFAALWERCCLSNVPRREKRQTTHCYHYIPSYIAFMMRLRTASHPGRRWKAHFSVTRRH